jgi:hypothetical protein
MIEVRHFDRAPIAQLDSDDATAIRKRTNLPIENARASVAIWG